MPQRGPDLAAVNGALKAQVEERLRAERVARGQTEALAKTLDLLAAEPELDSFVGQVLKALTEQLGAQFGSFWLYDADPKSTLLRLDYTRGPEDPAVDAEPPARALLLIPGSASHGPQGPERSMTIHVHVDIDAAPLAEDYRKELLSKGAATLLVVPLVSGQDLIGSFTLADRDRRTYHSEELELAQALAQQAVLAIQLTRLAEHRRRASVLEERNRIAREIHDTLAQAFTGILLHLRVAERIRAQDPQEAWGLIARVRDLAQEGLEEARRSVWDLQPEAMEYRDLVGALQRNIDRMASGATAHLELRVHGTPRELAPSVGMDLLRVGQEALTNALRHAQAGNVSVDLTFQPERVILRIQDDGSGFDVAHHADSGGFGLVGMTQRAERLGGELTITSRPGSGTEIAVSAPTLATSERPIPE